MPRRSKEQIKKDREELRELIQNMESVQDIMKWKNHPYEADNKLFTVEAYNRDIIDKLGWERPDVLYSFLGIYVIGLVVYYPDEYEIHESRIIKKGNKAKGSDVYDLNVVNRIIKDKHILYEKGVLKRQEYLDLNPQLKQFIKKYFSIGNVIPTWPGANVDRGCSCMYDIPELYYSKYEIWTRILNEMYKNAFVDDILNPNLVFENNNEVNYVPAFWEFSSTKDFLENIGCDKYSKEVRKILYSKWLERVVGIIKKRENRLVKTSRKKS